MDLAGTSSEKSVEKLTSQTHFDMSNRGKFNVTEIPHWPKAL
jgi:hypothetical protein